MGVEVLAFASIAASLAGAGISAYSMYQQGQAQEAMGQYNAKVAEQTATSEADTAQENAKRQREMNHRQLSAIRARMAGSGVSLSQGSSLDVLGAAASELELQTLDMFREGEAKQIAYANKAGIERWQGEQAATAGTIGAIGSLIGGVASTGQSMYSMRYTGTI